MVPVLSSTMAVSFWAVSRASAERMRIPRDAPWPVPTMIDRGVASPSAQGQAMISTDTAATRALVSAGLGPTTYQVAKVPMAMNSTAGTKRAEARSARRWMGALDARGAPARGVIWEGIAWDTHRA